MIFQPNQGYPRPKFAADFWYWLPDSRFFATPIMVSFTRVLNYRHSVCPRPFNGFNSYSFRPESSEASYFTTPFFRTDWSMGVRLPMLVVFMLHDDHSLQICQICLSPITKTHQVSRSSMQGMLSLLIVSYRVVLKTCGIQIYCFYSYQIRDSNISQNISKLTHKQMKQLKTTPDLLRVQMSKPGFTCAICLTSLVSIHIFRLFPM